MLLSVNVSDNILQWVCRVFMFFEQAEIPSVVTLRLMNGAHVWPVAQKCICFVCKKYCLPAVMKYVFSTENLPTINLNYACKHNSRKMIFILI